MANNGNMFKGNEPGKLGGLINRVIDLRESTKHAKSQFEDAQESYSEITNHHQKDSFIYTDDAETMIDRFARVESKRNTWQNSEQSLKELESKIIDLLKAVGDKKVKHTRSVNHNYRQFEVTYTVYVENNQLIIEDPK